MHNVLNSSTHGERQYIMYTVFTLFFFHIIVLFLSLHRGIVEALFIFFPYKNIFLLYKLNRFEKKKTKQLKWNRIE